MFEIRNRAEPANNGMGSGSLDMVDEQPVERHDFDLSNVLQHQLDHFEPLRQIKERMLGRVWRDGHHHFIKHPQTAGNDVGMTVRDGIERPRVNADFHEGDPLDVGAYSSRAVSPY